MLFLLWDGFGRSGGGARDFRAPPPRFLMPKRPPQFAAGASALNFITAHRGQWLIFSCRRDGVRGAFFTGRAFTPSVLLPTFAGQQDSFSRGRNRARSGNFPTMGNFQVRKWAKPHRGFAKKALAHPPKEAPTIRNFINQESICSPLKPTKNNTSSFFGDPEGRLK